MYEAIRSFVWLRTFIVLCVAVGISASAGCGGRTGLHTGFPPDTRATAVCQTGYCLTRPWCATAVNPGATPMVDIVPTGGALVHCIQAADDSDPSFIEHTTCLVSDGLHPASCDDPAAFSGVSRGIRVETPTPIWGPDGAPAVIYCLRTSNPGTCDGDIQAVEVDPAPDLCLLSEDTFDDYERQISGSRTSPIERPWEGGLVDDFLNYQFCGPMHDEVCSGPSGAATATTRAEWCGGTATDATSYSCDYGPPSPYPGTSVSQLGAHFVCPKQGPVMSTRQFIVAGVGDDASGAAGALAGPFCNLYAPFPMVGRLPERVTFSAVATTAFAPRTTFAVRNSACEDQRPLYGFADATLDPGVAQSGQHAVVMAGSQLVMTRGGGGATMPVSGEAEVYVGPDGAFSITDFQLVQANDGVTYSDSGSTFVVTQGILRMSDIWAGQYTSGAASPNVVLTAHDSSTTMTFAFNGSQYSIPLAPDRSPDGTFDGTNHLTLHAHYYDDPDHADFDLTLELQIDPRPEVVIDNTSIAPECRTLSDGRIGSVLTATGHAAPGTTFWQIQRDWPSSAVPTSLDLTNQPGSTATFELPLGAPSDPPFELTFTVMARGEVSRTTRTGLAVRDTTPPVFDSVTVAPDCLWSPNHEYALFRLGQELAVIATDECSTAVRVRIVGVTSDQPSQGGGSGNTSNDVVFGESGFCIRAERAGTSHDGRHYTITLEATDAWGNVSTYDSVVVVPHDQRPDTRCIEVPSAQRVSEDQLATRCVFADVPPLPAPTSALSPHGVPTGAAISPSLTSASSGGCSVAHGGTSTRWVLLLVAAALASARRRPRG